MRTRHLLWLVVTALLLTSGAQAQSSLAEANDILNRWVARKDTDSALLSDKDGHWRIRPLAAELYPALVLTAWHTNLELYDGLLQETLTAEKRLTSRLTVLPDDYNLRNRRFSRSSRNIEEILRNASAYAGGLSRIAAVVGPSPWTERLKGIVDALFLRADVATGYAEGALPSDDTRVLGRILKALPLLADLYNDDGYLYYARRIGDAYCVGVMPKNGGLPAERWNFEADRSRAASLILESEEVAFLEGLVSLYEVEVAEGSARADIYRPTLSGMFDVLFAQGIKENGRFYRRLQPDGRGGYSIDRKRESPHTLRILRAALVYGRLSGNRTIEDLALSHIARYETDAESHDADLPHLLALGQDPPSRQLGPATNDPVSDAARLYALLAEAQSRSNGVRAHPWHPELVVESEVSDQGRTIRLSSPEPWSGRVWLDSDQPKAPFVAPAMTSPAPLKIDTAYRILSATGGESIWDGTILKSGIRLNVSDTYAFTVEEVPALTAPTVTP